LSSNVGETVKISHGGRNIQSIAWGRVLGRGKEVYVDAGGHLGRKTGNKGGESHERWTIATGTGVGISVCRAEYTQGRGCEGGRGKGG